MKYTTFKGRSLRYPITMRKEYELFKIAGFLLQEMESIAELAKEKGQEEIAYLAQEAVTKASERRYLTKMGWRIEEPDKEFPTSHFSNPAPKQRCSLDCVSNLLNNLIEYEQKRMKWDGAFVSKEEACASLSIKLSVWFKRIKKSFQRGNFEIDKVI